MTLADRIIAFNKSLHFEGKLPAGIHVMNPFREKKDIVDIMTKFYRKYYSDNQPRQIILGINPGRLGSGSTGVPFTDTTRMKQVGLEITDFKTHEPSSVFVYDVINAYGGPEKFYKRFYITSVCPLGFTTDKGDKVINYNYYDSAALTKSALPFIVKCLKEQLSWPISHEVCYCMGTGKNAAFLQGLNTEHQFFKEVVPLEHPRYVMQYKSRSKDAYVQKYLDTFAAHV
ncbi:uracil-DNA glycosylase family protein [Chitinophaga sp. Cy-1792]|uniref:uracil-DNA glycosylase family protein n=1 Tax=Chitinophaga sp. Cy-1792 TaxID=2608339 RepID=UPI0014247A00|nr:uracil-DNA glycosylase family protein [Chitinophaga sp. Cy-1792]NIG54585.1 SMUG2 DNA glycosylase family protein [Chitinophaga sp. Cy-1792]